MNYEKRAIAMETLYRSGLSLQAIGTRYKLTRERVRQILSGRGITANQGGMSVLMVRRRAARKAKKDALYIARYGCDFATYGSIPVAARLKYREHLNNSRHRGIEFKLSLLEWWGIWQQSGGWEKRGRTGESYCMTRSNDQGAYEIGNVQIMTIAENCRIYALNKTGKPRRSKERQGVCLVLPGLKTPYIAYYKKQRLGYFATEQEAYAARDAAVRKAA